MLIVFVRIVGGRIQSRGTYKAAPTTTGATDGRQKQRRGRRKRRRRGRGLATYLLAETHCLLQHRVRLCLRRQLPPRRVLHRSPLLYSSGAAESWPKRSAPCVRVSNGRRFAARSTPGKGRRPAWPRPSVLIGERTLCTGWEMPKRVHSGGLIFRRKREELRPQQ